ncbi:MAG: Trp biosynthesis-associated membrane protein [Candidatus Nanopelagicales bacterium]|jgi:uncharacterized membrane protein (TIGR02234 family)
MRVYLSALLALALGALAILIGYGATWAVVTAPLMAGDVAPTSVVGLTGRELAPLGAAMSWVAIAGIAGLLATSGWGRRVVGGLLVVAGGIAGVTALAFALTDVAAGGGAFVEAALGSRGLGAATQVSITAWWLLGLLGGLAVLTTGMVALLLGGNLPTLSRRYDRGASTRQATGHVAMWDALDRGEDPTIGPAGSMGGGSTEAELGSTKEDE